MSSPTADTTETSGDTTGHEPVATDQELLAEMAMLKRRVAELEAEDEPPAKRTKDDITNAGRVVARLVDLFTPLNTLISALDAQARLKKQVKENVPGAEGEWKKYNRNLNSAMILIEKVPRIKELMYQGAKSGDKSLKDYCKKLGDGAAGARSDDFNRIRDSLVDWIKDEFRPNHKDELIRGKRDNRGLPNDLIGKLLCPYTLNWDDQKLRGEIRGGIKDISDDYYPRVLYHGYQGPPSGGSLLDGYLKSRLLVQTYLAIFTSPSSVETLGESVDIDDPIPRKPATGSHRKATKPHNAALMSMEGQVTPRSIAYAVVILLLNLTPVTSWPGTDSHNGFNYVELFKFIVDFFEEPTSDFARKHAKDLLKWWNDTIFPGYSAIKPVASSDKSRARLNAARANKENIGF